jgi:GntR family transcriptional regulator, transcriptional repressor for pyruvate dehydrogenase complex
MLKICMMTRQVSKLTSASGRRKVATHLKPLQPVRNLASKATELLVNEIRSGRLPPGSRLPTEHELMSALGVSRTVVREAVAALRTEGMVVTRQGSGAFVSADTTRVPFRLHAGGLQSLDDVLEVMELRLAIEVEAAARAAERVTPEHLKSIQRALQAIDAAIRKGEGAITEDFAFHVAIANASENPKFAQFLEFLGRHVIPRQSIRLNLTTRREQHTYLTRLQAEHGRIHAAIQERDVAAARRAMRTHLARSLERYRDLDKVSRAHHAGS